MKKQWKLASIGWLLAAPVAADGGIQSVQIIDDLQGGLLPVLKDGDAFGAAVSEIGDVDGNGVADLAVGVAGSDLTGPDAGRVLILFMDADGTVIGEGGFNGFDLTAPPADLTNLGRAITGLGDVDGDGTPDIAVSLADTGAIPVDGFRVVMLNVDGTLKSDAIYGASGKPGWGSAVEGLDDLDGNGVPDVVSGSPHELNLSQGENSGLISIWHLVDTGGPIHVLTIGEGLAGFNGDLDDGDEFGSAFALLSDLDGDGVQDLAVGAPGDDDGATDAGAVWLLFLDPNGIVLSSAKVSADHGIPGLGANSRFGSSLSGIDDFDGDGTPDLLVGSQAADGRFWIVFLRDDGSVRSSVEYDSSWAGAPAGEDYAASLAQLGDLDGDGFGEIVVSAPGHDGAGTDRGGLYVLFHEGVTAANWEAYGCGHNPAGSLGTPDQPILGTTMTFGFDNPLGTQTPGATFPAYVVSVDTSLAGSACGASLPGFHMDPAQPGELLAAAPWVLSSAFGPAWTGPGTPSQLALPIPATPNLSGVSVVLQGILVDVAPGAAVPFGLTRAVKLTLGI